MHIITFTLLNLCTLKRDHRSRNSVIQICKGYQSYYELCIYRRILLKILPERGL